ncbi:uncharacterized protein LOC132754623 [Ruditapes philippinarum]|uniref:uncharacterized protein LOC132754623 n=1 Tax=Ruditapes philippinarum TaxID=129788 RepID=UPI00295AE5B5|nr:uncharacterized protein LOC132754623 [Ruditapes philippinarum]
MSVTNRFYLIEEKLLLLKEYFQDIIEKLDTATDVLKKVAEFMYESQGNCTNKQLIQALLDLYSKIESKKHGLDYFINLGLRNVGNEHLTESKDLVNELSVDDFTRPLNAPPVEKVEIITRVGHEGEKNPTELETYQNTNDVKHIEKPTQDLLQKVILSRTHDRETKYTDKKLFGRQINPSLLFKEMKIGNLSEENQRKYLQNNKTVQSKGNIGKFNGIKAFKSVEPLSATLNFRLENGRQSNEKGIYRTYSAIFRNLSITGLSAKSLTHTDTNARSEAFLENHNSNFANNASNIVMMPCDIKGNSDELEELRRFLAMSTNNSYSVQIPQAFNLEYHEEQLQLVVDVTLNEPSRKPHQRRFIFRMHVVTSKMFENALQDCQMQSLELTYTNIFPRDCRMFIALPIYRDGFLDRKDRIDRE